MGTLTLFNMSGDIVRQEEIEGADRDEVVTPQGEIVGANTIDPNFAADGGGLISEPTLAALARQINVPNVAVEDPRIRGQSRQSRAGPGDFTTAATVPRGLAVIPEPRPAELFPERQPETVPAAIAAIPRPIADPRIAGTADAFLAAGAAPTPAAPGFTARDTAPVMAAAADTSPGLARALLDGFVKIGQAGVFGGLAQGLAGQTSIGRGLAAATGHINQFQRAEAKLAIERARQQANAQLREAQAGRLQQQTEQEQTTADRDAQFRQAVTDSDGSAASLVALWTRFNPAQSAEAFAKSSFKDVQSDIFKNIDRVYGKGSDAAKQLKRRVTVSQVQKAQQAGQPTLAQQAAPLAAKVMRGEQLTAEEQFIFRAAQRQNKDIIGEPLPFPGSAAAVPAPQTSLQRGRKAKATAVPALPRGANGKIDRGALVEDQTYSEGGRLLQWNGNTMVVVE
jgi:hypothetical protein